jgi:hypothetical protein
MAILTAIPGMEITIQSCDPAQDLPEYPDEGEWPHKKFHHLAEDRRVSKYVECVPNTEFRIRIVLKHPFSLDSPGLTFKASVDGHGIAQATCSAEIFARLNNMYMEIMSSKLERLSATEISSKSLKFSSITKSKSSILLPKMNFDIIFVVPSGQGDNYNSQEVLTAPILLY